jgi:hypothetical protein
MAISKAVSLANFSSGDVLIIDGDNDRVGVASTTPTETLTVVGVVSATSFFGDGSQLSGISVDTTSLTDSGGSIKVQANPNGVVVTGVATASSYFQDSLGKIRSIPQNAQTGAYVAAASDVGKHISITTGGVTVPNGIFSVGDAFTIYNNSGSTQIITQGGSVTLRYAGTSNTGNRNLLQYGICTVLCVANNDFVISGTGLS